MGCCFSAEPPQFDDPNIREYRTVTQGKLARGDSIVTRTLGRGYLLLLNTGDIVYRIRWGAPLEMTIRSDSITSMEITRAFRDRSAYFRPCYCSEEKCGDGLLDIKYRQDNADYHVCFFIPKSHEFLQTVQACQIKRAF